MAAVRPQVGIVEWARRARSAELTSRAIADALGQAAMAADDPTARVALLDRARRHGWCAEQWAAVVPVLHDVDLSAVTTIDDPALRAPFDAPGLANDADVSAIWEGWANEAGSVADAPFVFVIERTLRELRPDGSR
ncbi:MAG: hypothetical protein ABW033_03495 [Acidimicrobiia bacterium]